MISLVLGTAFFVGIHVLISGTTLRDRITDRIGEKAYMGLFSLASLFGIIWMSRAYSSADTLLLWGEPPGIRGLAVWVTMPIAYLFAVIGLTTPSPTAAGGEALLQGDDPVRGILRITRHPFLWGVLIWAVTHFIANGELASLIFFGGFIVLSIAGPITIDRKRARKLGDQWQGFADATSNVPFQAIAQGRNRLVLGEFAIWRVAAAIVVFYATYAFHDRLFH